MRLIATIDIPRIEPFWAACALAAIVTLMVVAKRQRIGRPAGVMTVGAMVLLAMAAGGVRIGWWADQPVQVLVDRSESTRSATYRDPAALKGRLEQLLGDREYQMVEFGRGESETRWPEVDDRPIVLFSDGRFELPASAPPIYAVIDAGLEMATDAAVVGVEHVGEAAYVRVDNSGSPRRLRWAGGEAWVPTGRHRVRIGVHRPPVEVELEAGDPWPENDGTLAMPQVPENLELWAMGAAMDAPARPVAPPAVPRHAAELAGVAAVVIDSRSAAQLDRQQAKAIETYVSDLGGVLILVAQDEAWAQLRSSALERISPLSVDPPQPQREWVVLLDASGSMGQEVGGRSRWRQVLEAVQAVVAGLPEADTVRLGSFGAELRWWNLGRAGDLAVQPPVGMGPRGPTDLAGALAAVAALPPASDRAVIVLTDAEVELPDGAGLARRLAETDISVYAILLSEGRGVDAVRELCRATGGAVGQEANSERLVAEAATRMDEWMPQRWHERPVQVEITGGWGTEMMAVPAWNQAWVRADAEVIARGDARPMAGHWRVGLGRVVAVMFEAGAVRLGRLAEAMAQRPERRELGVVWNEQSVELTGGVKEPPLLVVFGGQATEETAFERVGPRRWRAKLPGRTEPGIAIVEAGGQVTARHILPALCEREFQHVGLDRDALERLAQLGGGAVIDARATEPLPITKRRVWLSFERVCGIVAVVLLGGVTLLLRRVA